MRQCWYVILTLPIILLASCIPEPLDLALDGKLPDEESRTVITNYCQSCHIHRTFESVEHTPRMQALYDREPYTTAMQCRTCHLVGENTWGTKSRKTIFPADVSGRRAATPQQAPSRPGLLRKIMKWLTPASEQGAESQAKSQDGHE